MGTGAILNLGSYLEAQSSAIFRPTGRLSTQYEITALQHALDQSGRYPIVLTEAPLLADGSISTIPVVNNLTASRAKVAEALDIQDHRDAAAHLAQRSGRPIDPEIVGADQAPVQEIVLQGDEVDLTKLPALTQHRYDPGPYLTAAHATTTDPDTGVDNTAIQRCWLKSRSRMSYFPYPSSDNKKNLQKYWQRGEDCPIALWIGHHPAVLMGTQAKLDYGTSHWGACGGMIGSALRLVPSVSFGRDLCVPADAEIVIEGTVPRDVFEADGPFGEYTGYSGPQVAAPVIDVRCITMRRNAIYHDYGSGLADMLVPDNMAMEGKLFKLCHDVAPSVVNVHVPTQGRRFHAYIQVNNPAEDDVRAALMAALSYRRTKMVIAVDDDIDIFDDTQVLFALANQVQWSRDSVTVDGLEGSLLDPSLSHGKQTTSKIAIDATSPRSPATNTPRPIPPRSTVPANAAHKAAEILANLDVTRWPNQ